MAQNTKIQFYKDLLQSPDLQTFDKVKLTEWIAEYEAADTKGKAATMKLLMDFAKDLAEAKRDDNEKKPIEGADIKEIGAHKENKSQVPVEEGNMGYINPAKCAELKRQPEQSNLEIERAKQLEAATAKAVSEAMEKAKAYITTPGAMYHLPMYMVVQDKGIEAIEGAFSALCFVKGASNDKSIPQQHGIIMEELLSVLILHMKEVNQVVPSPYGEKTIEGLETALKAQVERRVERDMRGVLGTYKK